MNELRFSNTAVLALVLAWLIISKRDPLRIVAQGVGDVLRGGKKPQAWRSEATGS